MLHPIVLVFILWMSACAPLKNYDVTFNDQLIFTPSTLQVDDAVQDEALGNCIKQHLLDKKLKSPQALTALVCTQAGIADLSGIEIYDALEAVKLQGNSLRALHPLKALSRLEYLDVSLNPDLDCAAIGRLDVQRVILPEHCVQ